MGRLTALILGLAALSLLSVGVVVVVGWGIRLARRAWPRSIDGD